MKTLKVTKITWDEVNSPHARAQVARDNQIRHWAMLNRVEILLYCDGLRENYERQVMRYAISNF